MQEFKQVLLTEVRFFSGAKGLGDTSWLPRRYSLLLYHFFVVTSLLFAFQNCAKVKFEPSQNQVPKNFMAYANPLCAPHARASILIPKEDFDNNNLNCLDSFKLRKGLTPGLVCGAEGPAILALAPQTLSYSDCKQMTICGTAYDKQIDQGANYLFEFNNIPLGCDANLEVASKTSGELLLKQEFKAEVSTCSKCESLNKYTCGECPVASVIGPAKNGVCGSTVNTCTTGQPDSLNPGVCGGATTWICRGENGGVDSRPCAVANSACLPVAPKTKKWAELGGTATPESTGCMATTQWQIANLNNLSPKQGEPCSYRSPITQNIGYTGICVAAGTDNKNCPGSVAGTIDNVNMQFCTHLVSWICEENN